MSDLLRTVRAHNPGPFTLDGTRTHIVGSVRPAVVDPGPDRPEHVEAVARELAGAERVTIVLSHGHGDHAGALESLLRLLEGQGLAAVALGSGHGKARPLADGEVLETDGGDLVALHTPGHTPDHLVFHWPARKALFAGDLLMGEGDTTLVAGYPGCVADYLASLARVRRLDLEIVHCAHGPSLRDPAGAIDRFEAHRRERIAQVREALAERPGARAAELLERVYGDTVPAGLEEAARGSLEAVVEFVEEHPDPR